MALNPRQKAFVKEYIIDKNAARAARAAGYAPKAAKELGARLLTNANVRQAVDRGLAKQAEKADISAERVIRRIAEFAFDKKTIKASDTLKACELLGKKYNLFTDSLQVTGKDGGPQVFLTLPANGSEKAETETVVEAPSEDPAGDVEHN